MTKRMQLFLFATLILVAVFLTAFAGDGTSSKATTKEYKILSAKEARLLGYSVEMEMSSGWQPVGGVAVKDSNFYQAMAR